MVRRIINRKFFLSEDEINEAVLLLFKERDFPLPKDSPMSITTSDGIDITDIEVSWTETIE